MAKARACEKVSRAGQGMDDTPGQTDLYLEERLLAFQLVIPGEQVWGCLDDR